MECKTIKFVKKNGEPVIVNKVKYPNFFEAEAQANGINTKEKIYTKRVAYHCTICGYYHVGTSIESLNKPKPKDKKLKLIGGIKMPKVVGAIDLSLFHNPQRVKKVMNSVYINREIYHYMIKIKIVEVICPDGTKKRPKIDKILGQQKKINQRKIIEYISKKIVKK